MSDRVIPLAILLSTFAILVTSAQAQEPELAKVELFGPFVHALAGVAREFGSLK